MPDYYRVLYADRDWFVHKGDCNIYGPWTTFNDYSFDTCVSHLLHIKGAGWCWSHLHLDPEDVVSDWAYSNPEKIVHLGALVPCDPLDAAERLLEDGEKLPDDLRCAVEKRTLRPVEPDKAVAPASPVVEREPPAHPTLFREGNWDLREAGEAYYLEDQLPLSGVPRRLLARLIRAKGRAVLKDRLIQACGSNMEPHSLSSQVSRLRAHLRRHLGKHIGASDPISHEDPDSYRLTLL